MIRWGALKHKAEMDSSEFQNLSTAEVARLVRGAGTRVCAFPINGTRRWFALEHPELAAGRAVEDYLRVAGRRHVELYELLFDHGIDTLLTPVFGPELVEERGETYMQVAVQGLLWFAQSRDFLDFYDAHDVRVRVYGEVRGAFRDTPYAHVLDAFDELTRRTADHRRRRLFFGVCAHDASEAVARIGVQFHQEHGRVPTRREIVRAYYGEYVEPLDLFIGFDRPAEFDTPLLATGREDLYFTVSPSPYLDTRTLRAILHDHLYTRRTDASGYADLSAANWAGMGEFYRVNLGHVLGLGTKRGGVWYPLPQVELPDGFAE